MQKLSRMSPGGDTRCTSCTVSNSEFHDNHGVALIFEISGIGPSSTDGHAGALIAENNYFHDNQDRAIWVYNSQNVTIRNNRFAHNETSIDERDDTDRTPRLGKVTITGNVIGGKIGSG